MERRNARAGETGVPEEKKPPTRGIVRHDSHMRKSGVTWPGIEPGSPWWEASSLTAQPPNWAPVHNVCSVVATPLESRRATSCSYNSSHPLWHALYKCLQDIHGDSSPFLLQPFHELGSGFWPRLTSPHPEIQFVPNMFLGLRSGLWAGQFDWRTLLSAYHCIVALETWHLALSSWKYLRRWALASAGYSALGAYEGGGEESIPLDVRPAASRTLSTWRAFTRSPIERQCHDVLRFSSVNLFFSTSRGRGGRAVSLLASHLGDPGSIPAGSPTDFRTWESCWTVSIVFLGDLPFAPPLAFQRLSVLTSPHPSSAHKYLRTRYAVELQLYPCTLLALPSPTAPGPAWRSVDRKDGRTVRGKELVMTRNQEGSSGDGLRGLRLKRRRRTSLGKRTHTHTHARARARDERRKMTILWRCYIWRCRKGHIHIHIYFFLPRAAPLLASWGKEVWRRLQIQLPRQCVVQTDDSLRRVGVNLNLTAELQLNDLQRANCTARRQPERVWHAGFFKIRLGYKDPSSNLKTGRLEGDEDWHCRPENLNRDSRDEKFAPRRLSVKVALLMRRRSAKFGTANHQAHVGGQTACSQFIGLACISSFIHRWCGEEE
ncbi:hypothetical protein PR048_022038 [Dryococelus australis]|uniref:Uncharacterized protein n=1 Tax=Dryococelus australis TaxID=614101 RepID=A0ABQ9H036_9NEOP|nr:hypothetical protein PR048_022038 [Dryococelus australis]